MAPQLRVDGERLKRSLLEMATIGATPGGGVSRLALTDEDRQARDRFTLWAGELGLAVRVDDMGTQYARLEGEEAGLDPVLFGSHLDSVPFGGRFDGALGVLSAFEAVRTIREAGLRLRRPVEIVNFSNEEGARFEPALMASGVLSGRFSQGYVYSRTDRNGVTFGEALDAIGYRGLKADRPGPIHAFLELHIEQGPVLEHEKLPIAVVDGILGMEWLDVTLRGQAQHAGPSPMWSRRDAMVAAGRIITAIRDLALEYHDPVVTTVGRIDARPGIVNQIPGEVVLSIDVRHWTAEGLDELGRRARALVERIAQEEKVEVAIDPLWKIAPTAFDAGLVALLREEAAREGIHRVMVSGAGHDAKYISEIAPTAMIFVRTIGGKSHCETEAILWDDATIAADLLLQAVLRLAE